MAALPAVPDPTSSRGAGLWVEYAVTATPLVKFASDNVVGAATRAWQDAIPLLNVKVVAADLIAMGNVV